MRAELWDMAGQDREHGLLAGPPGSQTPSLQTPPAPGARQTPRRQEALGSVRPTAITSSSTRTPVPRSSEDAPLCPPQARDVASMWPWPACGCARDSHIPHPVHGSFGGTRPRGRWPRRCCSPGIPWVPHTLGDGACGRPGGSGPALPRSSPAPQAAGTLPPPPCQAGQAIPGLFCSRAPRQLSFPFAHELQKRATTLHPVSPWSPPVTLHQARTVLLPQV